MMLGRAEEIAPLLRTEHEARAVASLGSEFAEYRAAVTYFLEQDELAEAARLVIALFQFCLFQPRPEGHHWASMVADRLVGDEEYAAEVLGAAALASWFVGDMADAVERGRRAIAASEVSGGSDRWARTALIDALGYSGDIEAVGPHYVALVTGLRGDDDPFWQINGLGLEAIGLTMFGQSDAATRRAERALGLARQLGNPDSMQWGFYALGRVLAPADPVGACEAFEQAMRASREVDSRFHFALDLVEWAALKRRLGDWHMALAGVLDLLDLLSVSGNRSQFSQALRLAGLLLADAGRAEQAAIAFLARRGLPAMPTSLHPDADDERALALLEERLGDRWPRVRVKAHAFTEPELIGLCRTELEDLQRRWSPL
jgi:tetratricopeptide (TPR) repeat protein